MNHRKSDNTHRSVPADTEAARRLAQGRAVTSLAAIKPHIPLVKATLNRLGGWLPPDVSHSTLVGKGIMALLEAAECCTPDSPEFPRIAEHHIWHAVITSLHDSQCFTDDSREALEWLAEACRQLITQRHPVNEEALAERINASVDQVRDYLTRIGALFAVHPGVILEASSEERTPLLEGGEAYSEQLARAIAALPQAEQLVVALYYFEDLSFPEIATTLEKPLPEVQQLFGRAALLLQAHLVRELAAGNSSRRLRLTS